MDAALEYSINSLREYLRRADSARDKESMFKDEEWQDFSGIVHYGLILCGRDMTRAALIKQTNTSGKLIDDWAYGVNLPDEPMRRTAVTFLIDRATWVLAQKSELAAG